MNNELEENIPRSKKFSWERISSPEQLTNEMAWQIFRRARWNGEKKCIYCGNDEIRRLRHRNLNCCSKCRKKFSDRYGTPYNKARFSMRKIIFFIILSHEGIPTNKLYQVLGISKTAALRLSKIVSTCPVADRILQIIHETPLRVERIIYFLSPNFDTTFKYKKEYHLSLQRACKPEQNFLDNGNKILHNSAGQSQAKTNLIANDMFCQHGVAGGCRRCYSELR